MRKIFLALVILISMTDITWAGGYEAVTVTSAAAVGLTSTTYIPTTTQRADECFCTIETAQISIDYLGNTPTASVGHLINAGDWFKVQGDQIARLKAIAVSTTATMKCSCYVSRE